tara:strand:- start:2762 stop:4063 length:1302 start_codon:yes stop_codon:yes gene_type:complete
VTLNDFLKSHVDPDLQLPILNEEQWKEAHGIWTPDEFREGLARFIIENKPPYPRKISIQNSQQADNRFLDLCTLDMEKYIKPKDQTHDVMEKFDDYRRPYETHGLGVIDCGSEYNIISDYDMYEERMKCGSHTAPSPIDIWTKHEEKMARLFKFFYRLGNKELQLGTYIGAFRIGSYLATQFKPPVAKAIYTMTRAEKVLDTSCGWGDRLTAFYASPKAKTYIGCDPNGDTWIRYQYLCRRYEKLLGFKGDPIKIVNDSCFTSKGTKTVTIFRSGAEDLPWDDLADDFDCTFTSPPYFATERYAEGSEFEDDQSWKKFGEYELWRDKFFIPVTEQSFLHCKEGGYCMVNILDPVVKGKRYRAGDDLIDHMEENHGDSFLGQLGMRYMQRPKKTKTKWELDNFLKKCYIENIWVFRKGEERVPLFSRGLEDFFV